MALRFTDRRWHEDALGAVTFPAWSADARVPCHITDEALMLVFGAHATHSSLLEAFDKNLARIRATAAWKFEAVGDPVQITIVSTDFEPRAEKNEKKKPEPAETGQSEIVARLAQFRRAFHRAPSPPTPVYALSGAEEAALDDAFAALDADLDLAADLQDEASAAESLSGEAEGSAEELCAALE